MTFTAGQKRQIIRAINAQRLVARHESRRFTIGDVITAITALPEQQSWVSRLKSLIRKG